MADALWVLRMVEERHHRDDEDRPLREGRTPEVHLRPGDLELRSCPYAGGRYQHANPMNVAALRQTSAHWDDLLDALAYLRATYARVRGVEVLDVMDLWRVSQLGSALPWFFLLRQPPGGTARVPAYAAALAKATQGLGIWAHEVYVRTQRGWTAPAWTARTILAAAEANGTLIGDAEVCAGSEKMLLRFFEALLTDPPRLASPPLQRLAAAEAELLRFGAHYLGLKLALWLHFLARRFVLADVLAALSEGAVAGALRELLDGPCEPGDMFVLGPAELAVVPASQRAAWLGALAELIVPCAPDRSDEALRAHARELAAIVGDEVEPGASPLRKEIARMTGRGEADVERIARALVRYAGLDRVLGEILATVEAGFRGSFGAEVAAARFDAPARDRVLVSPPRTVLARLAPAGLAALTGA